jgi:hypothetical protein
MTKPRLTWHQTAPGLPLAAKLGNLHIGSVFAPLTAGRKTWFWSCWIGAHTGDCVPTEQTAKDALTACVAKWLRDAGLEQVKGAGE